MATVATVIFQYF